MSEELVLQKLCLAWNSLDVSVIEPCLDSNLHYHSFYVNDCFYSKEEYISYLRQKFENISKFVNEKVKAEILDENGIERVCLHSEGKEDILEVSIADGLIQKMLLRPPYTKFLFENFDKDYKELISTAVSSLNEFIHNDNSHNWQWLQNVEYRNGLNDFCIACDHKVLNIVIGLYRKNIEGDSEYCISYSFDNILYKCKKHGYIPCMFLIDSLGNSVASGCHLIYACTFAPLCLEPLEGDSCESNNDRICVF